MAFIKKISPNQAEGLLRRIFQARSKGGSRLWEIVQVQSLNAPVLRDSLRFYASLMYGESKLSRKKREMIAVVTSQINECHY